MQLHHKILIGMVLGLVAGVAIGPDSSLVARSGVELGDATVRVSPSVDAASEAALPPGATVYRAPTSEPEPEPEGWMRVQWRLRARDLVALEAQASHAAEGHEAGDQIAGWVRVGEVTTYAPTSRKMVAATDWLGQIFLRLIRMVVAPLVFLSLLVGVASLGDFRRLGRLGARALAYFTATTVGALGIGVLLADLVRPGRAIAAADRVALLAANAAQAGASAERAARAPSGLDQLVDVVPTNVFDALASGNMLQILCAALVFGVALTLMPAERARPLVDLADRANEAVVTVVLMAMQLAPFGVFALMLKVTATTGTSVIGALALYSATVVLGLLLHVLLVYVPAVRFGGGVAPRAFFEAMRPALMLAFSTSSSSATLPVTQQCVEDGLGVDRSISAFVLPLGATINMDGTALYQGVAALFIAQIYSLDLTMADQVTIVVMATLASIGAAGVPGAGMITLTMVLVSVGVPVEGIALIVGVDRILDMFRTSVNVTGDATAAVVMARLEGRGAVPLSVADDLADPTRGIENRFAAGEHRVEVDRERDGR
ncbi:MAG: dicarboxylate/amino acid:cation symporter [Myxococcales bacterium]|nr:dicarboxylate/amino acid:cation symporter [Myxococcales bacterium]MCB9531719.1 dicarboxylate/amino acid:cation symporter [Myxococcales bacterium]